MAAPVTAWAIVVDGKIDVRTVSETDVGAMVNWLCATAGVLIQRGVPDDLVRSAFAKMKDQMDTDAEVCPVEVRRVLQ